MMIFFILLNFPKNEKNEEKLNKMRKSSLNDAFLPFLLIFQKKFKKMWKNKKIKKKKEIHHKIMIF